MFDFTDEKLGDQYILNVKNILRKISDLTLWRYYINQNFKVGIPFSAPYRVDNNPSFVIYKHPGGKFIGKDFAGHFYGDIFNYLEFIFGHTLLEACHRVNNEFDLGLNVFSTSYICSGETNTDTELKKLTKKQIKSLDKAAENILSKSSEIQIVIRPFNKQDLDYWAQYNISYDILKEYNVYCTQRVFLDKKLFYYYRDTDPGYAYYFPKSQHFKIYFPIREKYRFLGNINNYEDIQGYWQCDVKNLNNNFLILTKSLKDVMAIKSLGFDAMAINGERHRYNEDFIRHIKKYYKNIVSIYDRDQSGMLGGKYLWKEFQIPPYFIHKQYKCKDISDLIKFKGVDITKNFLFNIKINQNEYS